MERVHKDPLVLRVFKESRGRKDLPEYRDQLDHKERGVPPDRKETWDHQVPPAPQQRRGEHEQEETLRQTWPLLACRLCKDKKENRYVIRV